MASAPLTDLPFHDRTDFADADRHPVMSLNQHLDHRDKMEEEGHSAQVDAGLSPADYSIQHGRKDRYACRRIENSRNS